MKNRDLTRRSFVKQSFALAAPSVLAANALPLAAAESESGAPRKLKVVCVGGHPDDPESGCAGTLTRYSELGHAVTIIYLTRGERGIRDKSLDEAAKIRSAECEADRKSTRLNSSHVAISYAVFCLKKKKNKKKT